MEHLVKIGLNCPSANRRNIVDEAQCLALTETYRAH